MSPATVSRVLNGQSSVGVTYRRRVLEAIEELGYRPNRLAQSLRRQRTKAIGVVVSDIENPHFSEMVRAIEDRADQEGYRVLVCNTDESPEKQRNYLQMLTEERVLGVVLAPSNPSGREISELLDLGIPLVALDREVHDPRSDAVIADNIGAARIAVELLANRGHRRIAFVSGRRQVETGAERFDSYQMTMRAHGLQPEVVVGNFRTDDAHIAVATLLAAYDRPTALIVANNLMTLGALGALQEAHIEIPREIALIGFDDPSWAPFIHPPLTTLAQPVRRMGTEAMELLLERISGDRTERRRTVHPFELHKRASCGSG